MPPPNNNAQKEVKQNEVELKKFNTDNRSANDPRGIGINIQPTNTSWSLVSFFSSIFCNEEPKTTETSKLTSKTAPKLDSQVENAVLVYLQNTFVKLRDTRTHMPDDVFRHYQQRYCKNERICISDVVTFLNQDLAILTEDCKINTDIDRITIERQYYVLAIVKAVCKEVADQYRHDKLKAIRNEQKYIDSLGENEKGKKWDSKRKIGFLYEEYVAAYWDDPDGIVRAEFMKKLNSLSDEIYSRTEQYREITHGISEAKEIRTGSSTIEVPSPSVSRVILRPS